jgi:hypothetical protein
MHTYRFRILSEENEDFLLDIEVKATQTFLDFHHAIKQHCNITTNELASFYLCDDKWRKKTEIMLIDMSEEPAEGEQPKPVLLMENALMNQVINNPHQKFLYVYDFLKMHTFYLEMMKICTSDPAVQYPALIKKEGEINLNKPSGLLGFIEEEEVIIPDETETFFIDDDQVDDVDDIDDIETDMFYGNDPEKF